MMAAIMLRVAYKHLRGKHILPDKPRTGGEGERFGCDDSRAQSGEGCRSDADDDTVDVFRFEAGLFDGCSDVHL